MTIIEIFQAFETQDQAIDYLESVRWHGEPTCPYCGAYGVSRHASTDRKRSRWQCHECRRAFSVTVGTIFHGTHVALRDWFILLALMLNAKKSVSSCQAARDPSFLQSPDGPKSTETRVASLQRHYRGPQLHHVRRPDRARSHRRGWVGPTRLHAPDRDVGVSPSASRSSSGFELAFKADALWVGTSIDGVEGPDGNLTATAAAVTRFRTGLEAARGYALAGRLSLAAEHRGRATARRRGRRDRHRPRPRRRARDVGRNRPDWPSTCGCGCW